MPLGYLRVFLAVCGMMVSAPVHAVVFCSMRAATSTENTLLGSSATSTQTYAYRCYRDRRARVREQNMTLLQVRSPGGAPLRLLFVCIRG